MSRYKIVAKGEAVCDGDCMRFRPDDVKGHKWLDAGQLVLVLKPDGEVIESAEYEGPAFLAIKVEDGCDVLDESREFVAEESEDGRWVAKERVQ